MPRSRTQQNHLSATSSFKVPTTFTDSLPLPSLIVFDLDYTLWPFWVDTHVSSPVKPAVPSTTSSNNSGVSQPNTKMLDRWGESFTFYAQVPGILAAARERGITVSLASRTHAPELAGEMLRGLQIPLPPTEDASGHEQKAPRAWDFFVCPQIYPGTKTTHFKRVQSQLAKSSSMRQSQSDGQVSGPKKIPFEDMLFFDDEGRNRNVESELGVTFWLVPDGVDCDEVDRGVWEWRKRRGITPKDLRNNAGESRGVAELEG